MNRAKTYHESKIVEVLSIDVELRLAASEDARLNLLLERTESEIISRKGSQKFLIVAMASIVTKICCNLGLML